MTIRSPWLRLPLAILFLVPVFLLQGTVWHLRERLALSPLEAALLSAAIAALGGGGCYALYVRRIERRPVQELAARGSGPECGLGFLIGSGLFGVVIGILALCGGDRVVGSHPVTAALVPFFVSIGAAAIEEILFRAVLFRLVEAALGTWAALAISSALFGLGHLSNPNATLQGAAAIALEAGVLLAGAYLVTRRLWLAIGVHAGWNFTQSGIFGVPTSGVPLKGWLQGELDGPGWLSGGAFGAEGSVVALAVCTLAGLALLRIAQRRGRWVTPAWRQRRIEAAAPARGTDRPAATRSTRDAMAPADHPDAPLSAR